MIEWMFQATAILSSNFGLLLTGAISALVILLWDWRVALIGMLFVQLSAASAAVLLHDVPAQWAFVQTVVVGLSCLMLFMSARAQALTPAPRQTGTWVSRGLLLGMLLVAAWFMNIRVGLPGMDPLVMELFVWLVLCGIVLLGLSDHPMYNGLGHLFWLIPVQVVAAVMAPHPTVVAVVGLVLLLVMLAISYLIVVEHVPVDERTLVLTDLAFPQQVRLENPPAARPRQPVRRPRLPAAFRRGLAVQGTARPSTTERAGDSAVGSAADPETSAAQPESDETARRGLA